MQNQKPRVLNTKVISESRCFKVEEVSLEFSNGEHRVYERLADRGLRSVMVVAMLDDSSFFLIREYAVGRDEYVLTLPAGSVDVGESYEEAANRELMEEIGYGASKLTHLGELTTVPGHLQHTINIVLAQGLYERRLIGDEPELLRTEQASIDGLADLLVRKDFHESRAIAAIVLAKQYLSEASKRESTSRPFLAVAN